MAKDSDKLDAQIRDLGSIENALRARAQNVQKERERLTRRKAMRTGERRVCDHAVLRYLERVRGFDIGAIRDEIRAMANAAIAMKDGEHHWHEASNAVLIIGDDGQVITILSPDQIEKFVGRKLMNGERVKAAEE